MSLLTLILIVLLVAALVGGGYTGWGAAPRWPYGNYPNYYLAGSLVWLIIAVVLALILAGQL